MGFSYFSGVLNIVKSERTPLPACDKTVERSFATLPAEIIF